MKRNILLLTMIGLLATAAATSVILKPKDTKTYISTSKEYQKCIADCKACIVACINCNKACAKMKDPKMNKCIQLCNETIAICNASVKLMQLNSQNAKELCLICAKVSENCILECNKFDMKECKDCAMACQKAAMSCKSAM